MRYKLAIVLVAFGAASQSNSENLHNTDAITLFERVCLSDKVSLPKSQYNETPYKQLPSTSRAALAYAIPRGIISLPVPEQPAIAEVQNRFVRELSNTAVFLMLPNSTSATRYSNKCAVIWQGKHYDEAIQAIKQQLPEGTPFPLPPPKKPARSVDYTRYAGNGVIFGAAEYENWTVLYVAPDLLPIKD
jgi:hypothetical protein